MCVWRHVWRSGVNLWDQVSPSTVWVLRIKLMWSGLVARVCYSQNHLIGLTLDSFDFPPWNGITLCLFLVM